MSVGGVAVLGIASTSAFHVVTGRGLGPAGFGLLAAFLAIVNIAAIGASALQNSVAVVSALPAQHTPGVAQRQRWMDSAVVEAVVLGGIASAAVVLAAPYLAVELNTSVLAVNMAALTMIPSFLLSVALGRLQGTGRALAVSAYSTGSQLLRVALAGTVLLVGLGAVSVLASVLVAIAAAALIATWHARGVRLPVGSKAFSRKSVVLILLTLAFAWLTNIDVVLVRSGTTDDVSGSFAAAAVLAKTMLLVPTTLSLYLLPRFAARNSNKDAVRFGVIVVLATVLVSGLAMAVGVSLFGDVLVRVLFGASFAPAAHLLPWLAVAYLPWALAQGLLISLTAAVSRSALVVLVVAGVLQWVAAEVLLPDLTSTIVAIGVIGLATTGALFLLHQRTNLRAGVPS